MNNYIPLNKAVGPKVICDGYQALIPQKLGVDAMTFNFDGSACEHATCPGAPEMFIKVEEDGLYYFGVEADDTGSLTIAGEQAIKKDGTQPAKDFSLSFGRSVRMIRQISKDGRFFQESTLIPHEDCCCLPWNLPCSS